MHRQHRQPKYRGHWIARARILLRRINAAIALSERYGRTALEWLLPMREWVREIVSLDAPAWWSEEDCLTVIPNAESRVIQYMYAIESLHSRYPKRGAQWAA